MKRRVSRCPECTGMIIRKKSDRHNPSTDQDRVICLNNRCTWEGKRWHSYKYEEVR